MTQHNYLSFMLAGTFGMVILAFAPIHLFCAFMSTVCLILAADLALDL